MFRLNVGLKIVLLIMSVALFHANSAHALTIALSFDHSTASAPAGFTAAVKAAAAYFENAITAPTTVTINVGWGEVAGQTVASGALGESVILLDGSYTYQQVRNALAARSSVASSALPTADPTHGGVFVMATAQANALGLGNAGSPDGYVGFDASAPWTFDPNRRAVAGAYDFIGVAEHEISEVLGRFSNESPGARTYTPLDLYRWQGSGSRALSPNNGQYFSTDPNGATDINTYDNPGDGDLADWYGYTVDAFNGGASGGVLLPISQGDLTEMQAVGYLSSSSAPPSPAPNPTPAPIPASPSFPSFPAIPPTSPMPASPTPLSPPPAFPGSSWSPGIPSFPPAFSHIPGDGPMYFHVTRRVR